MNVMRIMTMAALIVGAQRACVRADPATRGGLRVENGWFVHDGRVVWGNAQHNAWWKPEEGANITRRHPDIAAPNRTEDLDKLTDNMLRYGYPGFEHNFGLWYDRRRDVHDTARRTDDKAVPPFLEQPWARVGEGPAWDGLPRYDLTRYNPWYFERLREFAALCDRKGTILFHNFYMQHALLEGDTHYVDFPWRPANCLQDTGMPDRIPAANAFFDPTHPVRRELHRAYIRKCLDELSGYTNVIHLLSEEYTGPLAFMRFWLDVVTEWERETKKDVLLALGGTRDVLDALAADERFSVLDLRYWWYEPDGSLHAPPSGQQVAGRYAMGKGSARTTPQAIYRQVREYRSRYPARGLIHHIKASRQQTWAFLMGGGSMLVRFLPYPGGTNPPEYIPPEESAIIQTTYDFIRAHLADHLQKMTPLDLVRSDPERNWCLGRPGEAYLVYALSGGPVALDLTGASGTFAARWFDPRTGALRDDAAYREVRGGKVVIFEAPGADDWALWLSAIHPDDNGSPRLDPGRVGREEGSELLWYDARELTIEGKGWTDTKGFFERLPARAEGKVTPNVWSLSKHTAGIAVRFITDSPQIQAAWDGGGAMSHMAATGNSGLDLYRRTQGGWEFCGVGQPQTKRTVARLAGGLTSEKAEYLLYLPLYHAVTELKIGIEPQAIIAPGPRRPASTLRPIVFYGTSITQGGCASRAGMCHPAILGRWLDREVINLGFSGSGRMEPAMAELLGELDAEMFVLETLPNMTPDMVRERVEPFVLLLRKAQPPTPIVLVESPLRTKANPGNEALRRAFENLKRQGVADLHHLPGQDQLAGPENGTVDGVHPTDLGFHRMATAYRPVLEEILASGVGAPRAAGPIDVGSRKQLFIDDKFIARSRGITRTMNAPVKMNQPVLANDVPWEGEPGATIDCYSSVIKDGDKIRIWGAGKPMLPVRLQPDGPVIGLLKYAESKDGIHFTTPDLSPIAYDERKAGMDKRARTGWASVWIDPQAPPTQRYKSQAKVVPHDGRPAEFHIYSSPDGYHWTLLAKPDIGTCDTQSIIFWDDLTQHYLLYTRENPGSGTPGRRRVVRRLESADLMHWENERVVLDADDVDKATYKPPTPQPPVDYYGGTVFKYPDDSPDSVYIMIAHAFWHWQRRPEEQRAGGYDDHKFQFEVLAPATLDDRLCVSRDGIHFNRVGHRKSFLPLGLSGTFSSKWSWSLPKPIRMGDELWIYYFGDNRDHDGFVDPAASGRKTAIDRAILRLDGFVSADADYTGGEIVTPLITFAGNRLEINVDPGAGGSIRIELLDENERPIRGYTREDATPLYENSVCLPVTWRASDSVAVLAGRPIKIRFLMRDCRLYAFQFTAVR